MKRLILGAVSAFALSAPLHAQGVPTVDATQIAQLVRQLEAQARDYTAQIEQLAALKTQVQTQVNQLLNLESQLTALVKGTGVGKLFASVAEFQQLLGSLSDPLDVMDDIASGNWAGALESDVSAARIMDALASSGFDEDTLTTLSGSDVAGDRRTAAQAGSSAMLSVAAEEAHDEAADSLGRIETMVGLIDDQDGLKAAVDLNTRVTAELGIILTQMWRLEAASGINAGQLGAIDAATIAEERKFMSMKVDP